MIIRDKYGIIVQQPSMDGGDSAARMGIYALAANVDLSLFKDPVTGLLIRHPHQEGWDNPKRTSRDQLVQFCVSCDVVTMKIASWYCQKWFINKDFLSPAVKLYLYKRAEIKPPALLKILGYAEMMLSLVWNTKIKPNEEMNPFTCMCIVYGQWHSEMFLKMHPDLKNNIMKYWSGWRDQPEIGQALALALETKSIK